MALLKVYTYPEEVLKKVAKPIKAVTEELRVLAANMLETMYAAPGIGLAAPQVGESIRLVVIDTRMKNDDGTVDTTGMTDLEVGIKQPLKLFNPVITKKEGKTEFDEGCLSVPGYVETVQRSNYVEIEALDEFGKPLTLKTDGLLAICIQHELDHLDGKLFIDRLSTVKRSLIKSKIKKYGYPEPDEDKQHNL
ncbi:MAG: peptide deformylase [Oligoflexia bacterium]|nr:peptide deformylase [Oligoflexia bacterium]